MWRKNPLVDNIFNFPPPRQLLWIMKWICWAEDIGKIPCGESMYKKLWFHDWLTRVAKSIQRWTITFDYNTMCVYTRGFQNILGVGKTSWLKLYKVHWFSVHKYSFQYAFHQKMKKLTHKGHLPSFYKVYKVFPKRWEKNTCLFCPLLKLWDAMRKR